MFTNIICRALGIMLIILLGGCTQTTWQTESYKAPGTIADIKDILVIYHVITEHSAPDLNSLEKSVSTKLSSCGITNADKYIPMSYDTDSTILDLSSQNLGIDRLNPVLFINETYKVSWIKIGSSAGDIGRYYTASLFDMKTKNIIWKSDIYLTGSNGIRGLSASERGVALGNDVVDFMQKDGVIHGCQP